MVAYHLLNRPAVVHMGNVHAVIEVKNIVPLPMNYQ